jgi:dihydrodipicolinate synthase/N-acetylneuraminate lyase
VDNDMAAARRLHERLLPVARLMTEHNLASMAKAGLSILGIDVGSPRPPLKPADKDRVERLEKALAVVTGDGNR